MQCESFHPTPKSELRKKHFLDLCYSTFRLNRILKTDLETTITLREKCSNTDQKTRKYSVFGHFSRSVRCRKSWEKLLFPLSYLHSSVEQNPGKLTIGIIAIRKYIYTLWLPFFETLGLWLGFLWSKSSDIKDFNFLLVIGTTHQAQINWRSKAAIGGILWKTVVFKNKAKFIGKQLFWSLFFNKVAGLRPATLVKKRPQYSCFPVNFATFLRATFLRNTPRATASGKPTDWWRWYNDVTDDDKLFCGTLNRWRTYPGWIISRQSHSPKSYNSLVQVAPDPVK